MITALRFGLQQLSEQAEYIHRGGAEDAEKNKLCIGSEVFALSLIVSAPPDMHS